MGSLCSTEDMTLKNLWLTPLKWKLSSIATKPVMVQVPVWLAIRGIRPLKCQDKRWRRWRRRIGMRSWITSKRIRKRCWMPYPHLEGKRRRLSRSSRLVRCALMKPQWAVSETLGTKESSILHIASFPRLHRSSAYNHQVLSICNREKLIALSLRPMTGWL